MSLLKSVKFNLTLHSHGPYYDNYNSIYSRFIYILSAVEISVSYDHEPFGANISLQWTPSIDRAGEMSHINGPPMQNDNAGYYKLFTYDTNQ